MTATAIASKTSVSVLNASYEALGPTSLKRALILVLRGDAVVEEEDPHRRVRHQGGEFPWPLLIRMIKYIKVRLHSAPEGWSKAGVLKRDGNRCAYCGKINATTVDHIVPRAQGGKNTWQNTVASCLYDNGIKDNRTPEQAGMPLLFQPTVPVREFFSEHKN